MTSTDRHLLPSRNSLHSTSTLLDVTLKALRRCQATPATRGKRRDDRGFAVGRRASLAQMSHTKKTARREEPTSGT